VHRRANALPERARDRVLADEELRLVWLAAAAEPWPFGPLLQLLILTEQREAEVAGMSLSEIDKAERVWRLASERIKNDEQHFVPLSDLAFDVVRELAPVGPAKLLFSLDGERPVTSFSRFKQLIGDAVTVMRGRTPLDPWVFHDLRRTMVSGMARLGISLPVIERCINHKSGSFRGIVGVYQRHDFAKERRQAFEAWASFIMSIVENKAEATGKVYAIRGARS
jgi:integrase